MCGNVLIDLDQRFSKFQFTYLQLEVKGAFEAAARILYQANWNLPSRARVNDMPQFKPRGAHLAAELEYNNDAKRYCTKWAPIVWGAIAKYNDEMLQRLNED